VFATPTACVGGTDLLTLTSGTDTCCLAAADDDDDDDDDDNDDDEDDDDDANAHRQVERTSMPDGRNALLFQVLDTGPGLKGRDFKTLFDPSHDTGTTKATRNW
jgi:hypothetical protein